jgi:retron-type reverse transcriptase
MEEPISEKFQHMPNKLNNSILLKKTTETQVAKIINNLKDKSSAGHDLISPKLLKLCVNELTPIITKLINKAILENIYPDILKIAKVLPIYKSGDKTILNNYRPISILISINKIFEKILYAQLINHIEKNKIMYKHQYGFRKHHNTTHALISSYDYIIEQINNNKFVMGLFIDLRKAFDSINHSILINKLTYYGINGPFLNILRDYLKNRKIFTQIGSISSEMLPISYGVPQGSVLGPILFLLFINDIQYLTDNELKLFADDTNMFIQEHPRSSEVM